MNTLRYILIRGTQLVLTVFGVMTIIFAMLHASGDPAVLLAGPDATPGAVEAARARLGLDHSMLSQFGTFLKQVATLDFGSSYSYGIKATSAVWSYLPASMMIVVPAMILTIFIGVGIGCAVATSARPRTTRAVMLTSFLLQAIPFFWLALTLVLVFAVRLRFLPATGNGGFKYAVLPIVAMVAGHTAALARLTHGQAAQELTRPYALAARSKGISERRILWYHVLPNALPPLISYSGILFAYSVGSLIVLEPLFGYRGIGTVIVQAVTGKDFPVVEAGVLIISVLVGLVNLAADLLNRWIDPGLRQETVGV